MDTSLRILLTALAAGFIGVAALIVHKQRQAQSCELHNRSAGRFAVLLCVLSGLIGGALAIIAAFA